MNLTQLTYFLEVARQQSFTRAARVLCISQPGLSKAVKSLESELDVTLIRRDIRQFALTREGEILFEQGDRLLSQLNQYVFDLRETLRSKGGCLRVGVSVMQSSVFFPGVMARFQRRCPDAELIISEEPGEVIKARVYNGDIDIGMIMLYANSRGEEILPENDDICDVSLAFRSEHLLAVPVTHPLAERDAVPVAMLRHERFILLRQDFTLHENTRRLCRLAGFEPQVVLESGQWDFMMEMVATGYGITVLPGPIMQRYHSPGVKLMRLTDPPFPWLSGIMVQKSRKSLPLIQQFMEAVREENEDPSWLKDIIM